MKNLSFVFFALSVVISACKSDDKVVPVEVWSEGCAQLAPFEGQYRISGLCCKYILFPLVKFKKGTTIVTDASYHSFTGAGFTNDPMKLSIKVDGAGSKLALSYSVNGASYNLEMTPGNAVYVCDCLCD